MLQPHRAGAELGNSRVGGNKVSPLSWTPHFQRDNRKRIGNDQKEMTRGLNFKVENLPTFYSHFIGQVQKCGVPSRRRMHPLTVTREGDGTLLPRRNATGMGN